MLRGTYVVGVLAAIIPYGAVHSQMIALTSLIFAGLSITCAVLPLRTELQPVAVAATLLVGLFAIWVVLQGTSILGVNPAWPLAADVLGPVGGSFSISPYAGFIGLANLVLPFLAFIMGLILFEDDQGAQALLTACGVLALAGAVLGLYEYVVAPEQLLFLPRIYPMDGVTAYFVNRNTAATFLGMGAMIWCVFLIRRMREIGLKGLKDLLIETGPRYRSEALRLLVLMLCLLTMLVALFLTKSRAGISASLLGLMMVLSSMLISHDRPKTTAGRLKPVAAAIALVVGILALYGSPYLTRVSATNAAGDLRWCFFSDMISAIGAAPLGGTGYGSLPFAYPPYRTPSCMALDLSLDRGHNGYLELAMGMGLTSLILPLIGIIILITILRTGILTRRRMRFIPAAATGALVLAIIHTGLDFSLQIPGVAVFLAAILASGVIASRPASRSGHRRPSSNVRTPDCATPRAP